MNAASALLACSLLALAIIFGVLVLDARRRLELGLAALGLSAASYYRLHHGRILPIRRTNAAPAALHVLLDALPIEEREAVDASLEALERDGTGFRRLVADPQGHRLLEIVGHRVPATARTNQLHLLSLGDVTEREAAAAEARRNVERVQRLGARIEALPLPLWWRDETVGLVGNGRFRERPALLAAVLRGDAQAQDRDRLYDLVPIQAPGGDGFGIAQDRTDSVRLEGELARLVEGHRQVLESVSTAIAIWGVDARLVFSNSAFGRLWGIEPEWLAAEPHLSEFLDRLREMRALPEYADFRRFKADLLARFTRLDEQEPELLYLPDERTLLLTVRRHPSGGLIFIYDDVTSNLALERSYNTLTAVQRATLDNLFEGIAVFGSDGRLKLWNAAYAGLWQLTAGDLNARPHIATLIDKMRGFYETGEDWDTIRQVAIEQVTTPSASAERIERRDGSVLQLNAVPLPDGNVLLSYLDVTDTARVHAALAEKNAALDAATRIKSEFVANVTYELRTPLNAIIGFAEILNNNYFGTLNDRQQEYSRGVLDTSQRLLALINDILDVATIEAGQMVLEREPIDVHALLAGVLTSIRERAARLDLSLSFDCPTDIGFAMIDKGRMRQVLLNLVANAMNFTPAQGSVSLSARREGDVIVFAVEDTGVGIPRDKLATVFETFERGETSTHKVGAGLGLSLVRSLIRLHGGTVEIDSTPSKGTRVTCRIPLRAPAEAPAPPKRAARLAAPKG